MLILGKMTAVKKALGNVNVKFNATRALLLIGQGQMMVLQSATTANANYDKIMAFLHKLPGLENLAWNFNIDQARLLNSSLLCFECLLIAVMNSRVWDPAQFAEGRIEKDEKADPLLNAARRPGTV